MNQGEILNYLNIHTALNITKYDVKDIFIKNNLDYKSHRINGTVKIGVELYLKPEFNQESNEVPF